MVIKSETLKPEAQQQDAPEDRTVEPAKAPEVELPWWAVPKPNLPPIRKGDGPL